MRWLKPIAIGIVAWLIAISAMERALPSLIGSQWLIAVASPLAQLLAIIFAGLTVLVRPLVGQRRYQ